MIVVVTLALLVLACCTTDDMRKACLAVFGCAAKQDLSVLPRTMNRVAAVLIFIALLVVLNPEVRLLLLFMDFLGIDVCLMLMFFQLRGGLEWVRRQCVPLLWGTMRDWGPVPFNRPTFSDIRRRPLLTAYSFSAPFIALGTFVSMAFMAYLITYGVLDFYV